MYDAGEYVCRAENRLGRVEASANLTVRARPRPVSIVNQPHDMVAPVGATVQLPCKAEGDSENVMQSGSEATLYDDFQVLRHPRSPG